MKNLAAKGLIAKMKSIIKDINFLPENVIAKEIRTKKQVSLFMIIFSCTIILSIIIVAPIFISLYYQSQADELNKEVSDLSFVQKKIDELAKLKNTQYSKEALLKKINREQVGVIDITQKIKNNIPENVSLENFSISGRKITAAFTINSPVELINLTESLQAMNIFKDINITTFPIVDKQNKITLNLELK